MSYMYVYFRKTVKNGILTEYCTEQDYFAIIVLHMLLGIFYIRYDLRRITQRSKNPICILDYCTGELPS